MIAAWMLYATAFGACFCVAAVALERSVRLAGRPGRWIVAGVMVVSAVTPFVVWSIPFDVSSTAAGNALLSPTDYLVPITAVIPLGTALTVLDAPLVVCWIGMSTLLSAIVLLTHAHLARKISSYPKEILGETAVRRSPVLGPAVVGWNESSIVVPAWADGVKKEWRDLMVLHEQEHLRGRDTYLLTAAVILLVLLPWNFPLWYLLTRLRRAIELDCDQRVLCTGVDVRAYGSLLLEVSRRRVRSPLPMIGLALNRSFLAQRVDAMILQKSRFRYPRAVAAVVLGGVAVAIACDLPAPVEPGLGDQALPREVTEVARRGPNVLKVLFDNASGVTFEMRMQPGELQRIHRIQDIYAVANESTLVRVPEKFAERIRSGRHLLMPTEEGGEPVILLRELREQDLNGVVEIQR